MSIGRGGARISPLALDLLLLNIQEVHSSFRLRAKSSSSTTSTASVDQLAIDIIVKGGTATAPHNFLNLPVNIKLHLYEEMSQSKKLIPPFFYSFNISVLSRHAWHWSHNLSAELVLLILLVYLVKENSLYGICNVDHHFTNSPPLRYRGRIRL